MVIIFLSEKVKNLARAMVSFVCEKDVGLKGKCETVLNQISSSSWEALMVNSVNEPRS